jgi:hypothetical protein
MKKFPLVLTMLLLVAVVMATSAFTHPLVERNGVVVSYSAGSSITIRDHGLDQTFVLAGVGAAASNNGSNNASSGATSSGSSSSGSNSSGSSTSAAASPTTAATATPMATTTASGGSDSGTGTSGSGTANTGTLPAIAVGDHVSVFGQCFGGGNPAAAASTASSSTRVLRLKSTGPNANANGKIVVHPADNNIANGNRCVALFIMVRSAAGANNGTNGSTGGNTGTTSSGATAGTSTPAATTTAATETPMVTMTPTP